MLSSGSGDQLHSPPADLLWSWLFTVLVYWGLVSLPCPFSLGQVSDSSAALLLSPCCDGLLFVFQFCRAVWLWVLLTGSGDKLCGPLPALLQAVAYHLPAVGLPAFPAICLLKVQVEISSLPIPPSLVLFQCSCPFCCVLVFSLLFIVQFFFFFGWGGAQGAMLVFPRVTGRIPHDAWCLPLLSAKCLSGRFGAGSGRGDGGGGSSPPVFSV
jgi:hypothetical protein